MFETLEKFNENILESLIQYERDTNWIQIQIVFKRLKAHQEGRS